MMCAGWVSPSMRVRWASVARKGPSSATSEPRNKDRVPSRASMYRSRSLPASCSSSGWCASCELASSEVVTRVMLASVSRGLGVSAVLASATAVTRASAPMADKRQNGNLRDRFMRTSSPDDRLGRAWPGPNMRCRGSHRQPRSPVVPISRNLRADGWPPAGVPSSEVRDVDHLRNAGVTRFPPSPPCRGRRGDPTEGAHGPATAASLCQRRAAPRHRLEWPDRAYGDLEGSRGGPLPGPPSQSGWRRPGRHRRARG